MADSKKYNGSTWEHSLRKLTTAIDTFTTLPVDVYADGNNATVGLKGNTVQNGTPTPDNPIMPQGTGERTGNLLFKKIPNANIGSDGKITEYSSGYEFALYVAEVEEGKTYTTGIRFAQVYALYENEPIVGSVSYNGARNVISAGVQNITIPTGNNIKYIVVRWASTVEQTMFNEGSTALQYEPYGIKIPISSAGQTTPIYLGEVETERKIKKLVLTGQENWLQSGAVSNTFYVAISGYLRERGVNITICSNYTSQANINGAAEMQDGNVSFYANTGQPFEYFYVRDSNLATVANLKTYLAQQYAAGTPVTVWYVLANEETAVVNEPLMRIGGYADEVSGITIPTITSKDTFDVETTLKPSSVSLRYTGWHDATVKEWDGSQWT